MFFSFMYTVQYNIVMILVFWYILKYHKFMRECPFNFCSDNNGQFKVSNPLQLEISFLGHFRKWKCCENPF